VQSEADDGPDRGWGARQRGVWQADGCTWQQEPRWAVVRMEAGDGTSRGWDVRQCVAWQADSGMWPHELRRVGGCAQRGRSGKGGWRQLGERSKGHNGLSTWVGE